MTTSSATQRQTLHDADADARRTWQAFADAYTARRQAARALGARVGEIRLDNTWGEQTLLRRISEAVDALPTGEDLDAAVGRAVLAERARLAAAAHVERQRAEAKARFDEQIARNLEAMNRRFRQRDAERDEALAALKEAK